jgi:hypothetical protein
MRAYLKRFNEEMLNVEEFLEPITLKTLIRRVREYAYGEKFMPY